MIGKIKSNDRLWIGIIFVVSLLVIGTVVFLLNMPKNNLLYGNRIYILPKINAYINFTVSILLITGYLFIRNKNKIIHRFCMLSAFFLSVLFFVSYIFYHAHAPETHYGGTGILKTLYLFILLTHIVLAATIVPLVLLSLYRIWRNQVLAHRRIAKWTFPLWLYVSVTGVVVYLMISPYYGG